MQGTPENALTITSHRAARALHDLHQRRFLAPFLARDTTISQAAAELEAPLHAVYRQVERFQQLGLVRVTGSLSRACGGRPVKLYRSVADAFYIPFGLDREGE